MTLLEAIKSGKEFRLKGTTNWFSGYDSTGRQKITLHDVPYGKLLGDFWEIREESAKLWAYRSRETGELNGTFTKKPPRNPGYEIIELIEARK